ncbi:oligosaccharide flippase family protein [Candidatus Fermentibacterales bacterium]|nr:oligosaccharide flippase family protein [Candidatus Fermentibacterales bacterium]
MLGELRRETSLYGVAMVFGGLVQLVFLPFMSHNLTVTEAGELGILVTASGVIATFIVLGLPTAIIRTWQRTGAHRGIMLRGLLIPLLPTCVVVAVFLGLPQALGRALGLERTNDLVHAAALGIAAAYSQLSLSFLRAEGLAGRYLLISMGKGVLAVLVLTTLILAGRGGVGGFLAARWAPAFAVAVAGAMIMFGRIGRSSPVASPGEGLTGSMMSFGLPLLPASLAMLALSSADMIMLRHLHPDMAESGYYYWANTACMALVPLTAGFEMAWPRFIFRIRDTGGTLGQLGRAALGFMLVVVWASSVLGLAGPEIVRIVGGGRFADVSRVLPTLAGATGMYSLFLVSQTGPLLTGQTRFIAGMTLFGALLNVGFNFRLIPTAGAMGAAFATLGTNMFMALSLFWLGRKVFPINPLVVVLVIGPLVAMGPLATLGHFPRAAILFGMTCAVGSLLMVLGVASRRRGGSRTGGGREEE